MVGTLTVNPPDALSSSDSESSTDLVDDLTRLSGEVRLESSLVIFELSLLTEFSQCRSDHDAVA
jgi:hypothetical protein